MGQDLKDIPKILYLWVRGEKYTKVDRFSPDFFKTEKIEFLTCNKSQPANRGKKTAGWVKSKFTVVST